MTASVFWHAERKIGLETKKEIAEHTPLAYIAISFAEASSATRSPVIEFITRSLYRQPSVFVNEGFSDGSGPESHRTGRPGMAQSSAAASGSTPVSAGYLALHSG